jgi:hypothetical protein
MSNHRSQGTALAAKFAMGPAKTACGPQGLPAPRNRRGLVTIQNIPNRIGQGDRLERLLEKDDTRLLRHAVFS